MPPAKVTALNATSFRYAPYLKIEQKSPAKFVKVFAKPLLSREQNFPHFPLLVKGEFIT
jgi:hypothetical protein